MQVKTREDVLKAMDVETHHLLERWWDRGDGVAVYQNMALDSAQAGRLVCFSYGSKAAQIETEEPPKMMPDTGAISTPWAYTLQGVVK